MATKKTTSRKTAVKKTATKKTATKKTTDKATIATISVRQGQSTPESDSAPQLTTVVARVDVGWGNSVYIRGEGGGLSWNRGILMDWSNDSWTWSTTSADNGLTFKFLLNDEIWAEGENLTVPCGGTSISTPTF